MLFFGKILAFHMFLFIIPLLTKKLKKKFKMDKHKGTDGLVERSIILNDIVFTLHMKLN